METQTQGLNNQEIEMFNEISQILKKYEGSCRKFGLFHVHDHFDIDKDEVLYETNNPTRRTHEVVVKKKDDVKNAKPTQWVINNKKIEIKQYCCSHD